MSGDAPSTANIPPFLAALADPGRPPLPFRTAIVVAHPDDESIGCGAQLRRFSDLKIVHVTDGAPRNGGDAKRVGFASADDYARARRKELEAAVGLAGVAPERLVALGWADQEASLDLAGLARRLAEVIDGTEIVLTHAYEGGHPDHDATAFAVRAACLLLGHRGAAPLIVEMPLYHAGPDGMVGQAFVSRPDCPEVVLALSWEEQRLKQAMYAAHASQHDVLLLFHVDSERFRVAPRYLFDEPPNGGSVHYARHDWGMTPERWSDLAGAALAELGLGRPR